MRLKPALHYQLDYMARSSLTVLGIVAVIIVFFMLIRTGIFVEITVFGIIGRAGEGTMMFGIGAVITIMLFVVGIAGIREDLRLLIQHGMGRSTTFYSTLIASLVSGAVLGLFCELLNTVSNNWPVFPVRGLSLTNAGSESFFLGWFFHMAIFFFAWQLGALISIIFYRLSRMQQILFSITVGGLLIFVLSNNIISSSVGSLMENPIGLSTVFAGAIFRPINLVGLIFSLGIIAAASNFLLIRHAQIKE